MSDERRLERLEVKIDDLSDAQGHMNVILASQHQILIDHQRRSLANEKAVEMLSKELKPVLLYSQMIKLVIKTLTIAAVVAESVHVLWTYLA